MKYVGRPVWNADISILFWKVSFVNKDLSLENVSAECFEKIIYEPPHGKTNNLHRRKQRRRSASR